MWINDANYINQKTLNDGIPLINSYITNINLRNHVKTRKVYRTRENGFAHYYDGYLSDGFHPKSTLLNTWAKQVVTLAWRCLLSLYFATETLYYFSPKNVTELMWGYHPPGELAGLDFISLRIGVLAKLIGGRKVFQPLKGVGLKSLPCLERGGTKSFKHVFFQFCSPPPHNQSL